MLVAISILCPFSELFWSLFGPFFLEICGLFLVPLRDFFLQGPELSPLEYAVGVYDTNGTRVRITYRKDARLAYLFTWFDSGSPFFHPSTQWPLTFLQEVVLWMLVVRLDCFMVDLLVCWGVFSWYWTNLGGTWTDDDGLSSIYLTSFSHTWGQCWLD